MQIRSLCCYGSPIYTDAFSFKSANKSFNMYGLTSHLHADDEDDRENACLDSPRWINLETQQYENRTFYNRILVKPGLHEAVCLTESFVFTLGHCVNF